MKLYRVTLKSVEIVSLNPDQRRLVVVFKGEVKENLLEREDPCEAKEVSVIFPAYYRAWGTKPSEFILKKVLKIEPDEFWDIVGLKVRSEKLSGSVIGAEGTFKEVLEKTVTLEDVKHALKLFLDKKMGQETLEQSREKEFILVARPLKNLFGVTSLNVAKPFSLRSGTSARKWVKGDLSKIKRVVYGVAEKYGYTITSAVEGETYASYYLEKTVRNTYEHRIKLSLPLFAKGEAYKIWAYVNGVRTYPLLPIRIMVYGKEYSIMYVRVPHTKGYVDSIKKKLEDAARTVEQQIYKYKLLHRPITEDEFNKVSCELPDSLRRKVEKLTTSGFDESPVTWAELIRRAENVLAPSEFGYLVACVLVRLEEEPVREKHFALA